VTQTEQMRSLKSARKLFFFDFDQTFTLHDVCTRIPLLKRVRNQSIHENNWKILTQAFQEKYNRTWEEIKRDTVKSQWEKSIYETIERMDEIELYGVTNLKEKRVLADISRHALRELGSTIHPKDEHITQFIDQHFARTDFFPLYCVSTNWSFDVIASGIQSVAKCPLDIVHVNSSQIQQLPPLTNKPTVRVFSNDLDFHDDITTGAMFMQCVTATQKKEFIQQVIKAATLQGEPFSSFYIGDELPDVLAILEAGYGIVMKPSPERYPGWLNLFMERFGEHIKIKSLPPLQEAKLDDYIIFYAANSWADLLTL
jgi:phosphoserine phosphatase